MCMILLMSNVKIIYYIEIIYFLFYKKGYAKYCKQNYCVIFVHKQI